MFRKRLADDSELFKHTENLLHALKLLASSYNENQLQWDIKARKTLEDFSKARIDNYRDYRVKNHIDAGTFPVVDLTLK